MINLNLVILLVAIYDGCSAEPNVAFYKDVKLELGLNKIIEKNPIIKPSQEYVHVSAVKLPIVPHDMVKSNFIRSISLEKNGIYAIESDTFNETPNLEYLDLSNNKISWNQFKLRHRKLETLILDNQIPSEADIMSFDISNEVSLEDLAYLSNLKTLSWKGFGYVDFPRDLSKAFPNITDIYLSDSNFAYMDHDISDVFPYLRNVHLENNNMKRLILEGDGHLEGLYLDGNPFEFMELRHNYLTLKTLSLSNCSLTDPFELMNYNSLTSLDLSNNHFYSLAINAFENIPYLENLDLSYNRLYEMPYLGYLNYLKKVSFSNNVIDKITTKYMPNNLIALNLRKNQIRFINPFDFLNLTKLEELDLSENLLQSLPFSWDAELIRLRYLNLKSNQFASIELMAINKLSNLQDLLVKDNYFSKIGIHTLQTLPETCTVHV